MSLSVIYRVCKSETEGNMRPERPSWFSKFSSFRNYYGCFNGIAKTYVVWDGPESNLSDFIRCFKDIEFIKINECNNQKSLLYCYNLFESIKSDYVYFLEDDFEHRCGSGKILMEGLEKFKFVSLYDHPDRYFIGHTDVNFGQEMIFLTKSCHWRTAESTTCTVAMSKEVFDFCKYGLKHFCNVGNGAPDDRGFYRKALSEGLRLLTPIPGYSTHCVEKYLSPHINWEQINK